MMRILLALVIGGGFLVFLGVQEMRLASGCKAEPQTITYADLASKGFGDNAHVILSDFLSPPSDFVYEEKGGKYSKVWLPVVSLTGPYAERLMEQALINPSPNNLPRPSAKEIRVIVMSEELENDAQIEALMKGDTIQGVITNKIASISGEERKLLQESYPGVDFDTTYILEHARTPASSGKSFGMMGGGALLAVGGIFGFLRRRGS